MTSEELLNLKVLVFYQKFQVGGFPYPIDLAKGLEALANEAWNVVDEMYPPSLKIDP